MKTLRVLAAASLALVMPTVSVSTAGATNNIRDLCRELVDLGIFATHGECMSAINKSAVQFCKDFGEVLGYKNQGQCVSDVRASYNEFKKA